MKSIGIVMLYLPIEVAIKIFFHDPNERPVSTSSCFILIFSVRVGTCLIFILTLLIFTVFSHNTQVTLYHILKLFHSSPGTSSSISLLPAPAAPDGSTGPARKILVAECYEELLFQVR